jgi:2-methylcitrate dehydratase PrpD
MANSKKPPTMRDVLTAMIKAHEIQGVIALENSFNRVGLTTCAGQGRQHRRNNQLLGHREEIINAVASLGRWPVAAYRHSPSTGSQELGWGCHQPRRAPALITLEGEMGYPSVLTAKTWGFYDVLFKGSQFVPAALWLLRDGARAVQDLFPRVPRADCGRVRYEAAAGGGTGST